MIEKSFSDVEPKPVVVLNAGPIHHVWMHRDIQKKTQESEEGAYEYWECNELYFTTSELVSEESIETDFDAVWNKQIEQAKSDTEKIADVAEDSQAQLDYIYMMTGIDPMDIEEEV